MTCYTLLDAPISGSGAGNYVGTLILTNPGNTFAGGTPAPTQRRAGIRL